MDEASDRRGRPGTAALRLSIRVLTDGASDRRGRPGTAALRPKSICVLTDGASDRRGRPRTDALRQKRVSVLTDEAYDRWGSVRGRLVWSRGLQSFGCSLALRVGPLTRLYEVCRTREICRFGSEGGERNQSSPPTPITVGRAIYARLTVAMLMSLRVGVSFCCSHASSDNAPGPTNSTNNEQASWAYSDRTS